MKKESQQRKILKTKVYTQYGTLRISDIIKRWYIAEEFKSTMDHALHIYYQSLHEKDEWSV